MNSRMYDQVSLGEQLGELCVTVTTTDVICGALASRDYSPLHHDYHYATQQAGHRDIFLNTPHQAAFFERYLSDWSGPKGRLGRMRFSMRASVYAGDDFVLSGEVVDKAVDQGGCGWLTVKLQITVDGKTSTECEARYAMPLNDEDNPWQRRGEEWQP